MKEDGVGKYKKEGRTMKEGWKMKEEGLEGTKVE